MAFNFSRSASGSSSVSEVRGLMIISQGRILRLFGMCGFLYTANIISTKETVGVVKRAVKGHSVDKMAEIEGYYMSRVDVSVLA